MIAIAPLCITVASPLTGYFVSVVAAANKNTLLHTFVTKFFTLQLLHLGLKFTRLAGLLLTGGCLILFGQVDMCLLYTYELYSATEQTNSELKC